MAKKVKHTLQELIIHAAVCVQATKDKTFVPTSVEQSKQEYPQYFEITKQEDFGDENFNALWES